MQNFVSQNRIWKAFDGAIIKSDLTPLLAASFFSKPIVFLSSLVIARLYLPEEFGKAQYFLTIASIVALIMPLGFDFLIVLTRVKVDRDSAVRLSLFSSTVILVALSVTLLVYPKHRTFFESIVPLSVTLAMSWIIAAAQVLRQSALWERSFKRIGMMDLLSAILIAMLSISLGYVAPEATSILVSTSLGTLLAALVLLKFLNLSDLLKGPEKLLELALRNLKYPLYTLPSRLVETVAASAPVLMMFNYSNGMEVGFFSIASRLLSAPAWMVSRAVAEVFYSRASSLFRTDPESLPRYYAVTTLSLFAISLVPVCTTYFFAQPLITQLFGESWSDAAPFLQILTLWILFDFITSPVDSLFLICGRQRLEFVFKLIMLVFRIFAIYLFRDSSLNMTLAFSIGHAITCICSHLLFIRFLSRVSD